MASESCIHPSCNCKAYKDPGHQKGTLLLLRLDCKQCGHHGSEHRRLTAVDGLVREEVERAAGTRCSHLIPLSEIPHSPVFGPHDPIPIPYDSLEHGQGSAVQCTCSGFHVPSLVKLWQSFRTCSMSGAISALPKITCSTCQHTLQSHQPMETSSTPTDSRNSLEGGTRMPWGDASTIIQHPQLTLKASTKLALPPFNSCIQILPPENKTGNMVLVSLHSAAEGDLHIVVCSVQLALEKREQIHTLLEETAGDHSKCGTSVSKDSKELESCLEKQSDMTEENSEGNIEEPLPAKKKSRRRKRITRVNVVPRKSARLQKQSGKKNALENKQAVARLLEEERKRRKREIEQARAEQQMLCRCIVEYVSSMEKKDSFTHYPLPEAIARCTIETTAVASSEGCLLVALGTTAGSVFVVAVAAEKALVWVTLDTGTCKDTVKSLSWLVQSAEQLSLCAGYNGGSVAVWKIRLSMTNSQVEHSLVVRRQDTQADITMCTWAPNKTLLAVGSQLGEVLLYLCSPDDSCSFNQTVRCGGSAITCATWIHDDSVLAVGGTDDSIHVLQRKQSPSSRPGHPQHTQSSLLSYFKPVDSDKFIHTHWLRGHCSFVSSLLSLGLSSLLSLGWDSRVLFWQGIEPIKDTSAEVFPIEDSEPQCGFKLGPSTTTQFLPLSMCEALGFGVLILLTDRARDVHLTYYTFTPRGTNLFS